LCKRHRSSGHGDSPLTVPTHPFLHLLFDLLAWASAALLARLLYRWRLKDAAAQVVGRIGPFYIVALAFGAVAGAWGFGSINTGLTAVPHPSHSIAGGLAGAIIAVELYKAARGISGSTGTIWVGPLALGIAVGRLGCLFAGLPDETFGIPTGLPWGVDLGDGVTRHPVQLYESLAMLGFLAFYLAALRRRLPGRGSALSTCSCSSTPFSDSPGSSSSPIRACSGRSTCFSFSRWP
jgi:hypothetical protein